MAHRYKSLVMAIALGIAATAASAEAQLGFDGDKFVTAVRERNGSKAIELLEKRPSVVNARDTKGDTGLIVAIAARDPDWTGYLLNHGADASLPSRSGDTPLIAAARVGFEDAVPWLIVRGARVDAANRMGETPLIVAVQQRQIPVIRLLLAQNADPDKTDAAQGYSARDYAKRDNRGGEILRLIEAKKPKPAVAAAR